MHAVTHQAACFAVPHADRASDQLLCVCVCTDVCVVNAGSACSGAAGPIQGMHAACRNAWQGACGRRPTFGTNYGDLHCECPMSSAGSPISPYQLSQLNVQTAFAVTFRYCRLAYIRGVPCLRPPSMSRTNTGGLMHDCFSHTESAVLWLSDDIQLLTTGFSASQWLCRAAGHNRVCGPEFLTVYMLED